MKHSSRSKSLYKKALININNAYERIEQLEKSLNFQGFYDNHPVILIIGTDNGFDLSLNWRDVFYDMDEIFKSLDENGRITPNILENILYNI